MRNGAGPAAPEGGPALSSPSFPFQPLPLEAAPLLRWLGGLGSQLRALPALPPTCPAYFPRGSGQAGPGALPAPTPGTRPSRPLPSPTPAGFPIAAAAPRALPPLLLLEDSLVSSCWPTLRQNFFSALFWAVSPWGGGAGLRRGRRGSRGRVLELPASGVGGGSLLSLRPPRREPLPGREA